MSVLTTLFKKNFNAYWNVSSTDRDCNILRTFKRRFNSVRGGHIAEFAKRGQVVLRISQISGMQAMYAAAEV